MRSKFLLLSKIVVVLVSLNIIQVTLGAANKTNTKPKSTKCYGKFEKKKDKEICDNLVPKTYGKPQKAKSPFKMTGGQDKDFSYYHISGDAKHVITDAYISIYPSNPKFKFAMEYPGFKTSYISYCCEEDTTYQGRILKPKKVNPNDNKVEFKVDLNKQNVTIRVAVIEKSKYWIMDHPPKKAVKPG